MFSSRCRNTDQFLIWMVIYYLYIYSTIFYHVFPLFSGPFFPNTKSVFQEVFSKKELPYPKVENTIILQLGTVPETENGTIMESKVNGVFVLFVLIFRDGLFLYETREKGWVVLLSGFWNLGRWGGDSIDTWFTVL